jgi:hypothetical protein
VAKVRGLLSKAETTEFPDEADAFTEKAQQLITRHCLSRALLDSGSDAGSGARSGADRAGADRSGGSTVEARRCWLQDPYLQAKALLGNIVASANRCRGVLWADYGLLTIVGHPDDLDATEVLFTSLLVQATRGIMGLATDPDHGARSRRPAYRRSFLVAFAIRIGARLREADAAATRETDRATGAVSSRYSPIAVAGPTKRSGSCSPNWRSAAPVPPTGRVGQPVPRQPIWPTCGTTTSSPERGHGDTIPLTAAFPDGPR